MLNQAKVAFFTPYYRSERGNSTTTKRIIAGLTEKAIAVDPYAYSEQRFNKEQVETYLSYDLLHALHFHRFAEWVEQYDLTWNQPLILHSGGTDVNERLQEESSRKQMEPVLYKADHLIVFTENAKEKVLHYYPQFEEKLSVISQSVWLPKDEEPSVVSKLPSGYPKILLPAGLRKVKDIFYVMSELKELQREFPELQFVIAGSVIDETVYKQLQEWMRQEDWIHFIGEVPFNEMRELYSWAEVVLNTSISEGQSSAILEAMESGSLVMVRRNGSNESIVQDEVNGYLFGNPNEFLKKLREIILNQDAQIRIKNNGRQYVRQYHELNSEVDKYIKIYKDLLR